MVFVTTTFVLTGFPQHIMCFVVHGLPHRWSMSGTMGEILFGDVPGNWQDVVSCFVQLSIPFCRLHALAACAVDNARFPIESAIRALYFGRSLAKLNVFRVAHAGDQLLRVFAERIELFSLVQILYQRVTVRLNLELLNQSFDGFFAIRVFFLDG